ncbi:hypothetical protein K2X30_00640 [bacterium]|jgi:hypothetical protein|nr:hypothetical protein [bacterium]
MKKFVLSSVLGSLMFLPTFANAQEIRTIYTHPISVSAALDNSVQMIVVYDNSQSIERYPNAYLSILDALETSHKKGPISVTLLSTTPSRGPIVENARDVKTLKEAFGRLRDMPPNVETSNERGLVALEEYFTKRTPKLDPHLRTLIVFVTDQEDSYDTPQVERVPVQRVVQAVKAFFDDEAAYVGVSGLFGAPDLLCASENGSTWQFAGSRYAEFSNEFISSHYPLCSLSLLSRAIYSQVVGLRQAILSPERVIRIPLPVDSNARSVRVRVKAGSVVTEHEVTDWRQEGGYEVSIPVSTFKRMTIPADASIEASVVLDGPHPIDVKGQFSGAPVGR